VGDSGLLVERRAAGGARGAARLVLRLAPLALEEVHGRCVSPRSSGVRRRRWGRGSGVRTGRQAATAVPQESQNLAPGRSSAWQFAQVASILPPQESQNFAPSRTWAWQLGHSTVAGACVAAGAACAASAAGAAPGGAAVGEVASA